MHFKKKISIHELSSSPHSKQGAASNPLSARDQRLSIFILAGLLLFLLLLLAGFWYLAFELNTKSRQLETITNDMYQLLEDYNLLRQSLGLAPLAFDLTESKPHANYTADVPLIQGLKLLQTRFNDEKRVAAFQVIRLSPELVKLAQSLKAMLIDNGLFSCALIKDDNIWFNISYQPPTASITIEGAGLKESYQGAWGPAALSFMEDRLTHIRDYYLGLPQIKNELRTLAEDTDVKAILARKQLKSQLLPEDYSKLELSFCKDSQEYLAVSYDKLKKSWLLATREFKKLTELKKELLSELEKLDTRSPLERQVAAVEQALKESFLEPSFIKFLKEAELSISFEPRQTDEFYYFDLKQQGIKIGAVAISRRTAEVYFVDKDDIQVTALRNLSSEDPLKKKQNQHLALVNPINNLRLKPRP